MSRYPLQPYHFRILEALTDGEWHQAVRYGHPRMEPAHLRLLARRELIERGLPPECFPVRRYIRITAAGRAALNQGDHHGG